MNKITEKINCFGESLEEQRLLKAKLLEKSIKQRTDLIREKNQLITNLNYEKDLITDDIVNIIKQQLVDSEFNLIFGFSSDYFHTVWLYNQDKEFVKDKDKAKQLFKWITEAIKEKILFNDKQFKLIDITIYGYDRHAYSFQYKYKNHKFDIKIPMFNTVDRKNYKEMLLGYQIYYYTSDNCSKLIANNLDYRQLANDFKQYLESLEETKDETH